MDAPTPPPRSPKQSGGHSSLYSWTNWWPLNWMPTLFSAPRDATSPSSSVRNSPLTKEQTAAFEAGERSTPRTPGPASSNAINGSSSNGSSLAPLSGVPPEALLSFAVQPDKKEMAEGPQSSTSNTPSMRKSTTSPAPPTFVVDLNMNRSRAAVSKHGSGASMATDAVTVEESSAGTTPRPSSSSPSTPPQLTPSMAPLSEEAYTVRPWVMMGAPASANTRGSATFLLPASTSGTDVFTVEQMRTPPACVELPGPQSLFVRGAASSGCDSHSIDLLQKSVLAEQRTAPEDSAFNGCNNAKEDNMGQDQSRARNGPAAAAGGAEGADAAPARVAGSQGSTVATVPLAGIEGFQVVRLLPFSPAHKAGIVPYFDIITALDHVLLESEGKPALQFFKSYIANHRDQPVCFTVFNLHIRAYRDVYCVPSDAWGGGGVLGCSIEWSRADACPERCVHVVDVLEGSPAAHSGELRANRDYIIGMQTAQEPLISLIKNQKDFYSRLEGWHEEQRWTLERKQRFPNEAVDVPHILLFLVYNSESNTVKEVAVEMGTNPEAALGMSVATGLLHIIPSAATAGDASTAASLPVMNKFVQLEANHAVTSIAEAPAPTTLAPPPPFSAEQQLPPQQPQDPPQPEAVPHSDDGHATPTAPAHESVTTPLRPSPLEEGEVAAAGSVPVGALASATASVTAATLPDYPPTYSSQQPPSYPMPPSLPDSFIPPPREEAAPRAAEPAPPTAAAPPPTAATNQNYPAKKSPFYSALASVQAYEHPQTAGGPTLPSASRLLVPNGSVNHPTLPTQQPPHDPYQQQPQQHDVVEVAPPVVPPLTEPPVASSTSLRSAHDTPVPPSAPPPPPSPPQLPTPQPVPQRATFSMSNIPPPLNYPVFPGAAMKRQHK